MNVVFIALCTLESPEKTGFGSKSPNLLHKIQQKAIRRRTVSILLHEVQSRMPILFIDQKGRAGEALKNAFTSSAIFL